MASIDELKKLIVQAGISQDKMKELAGDSDEECVEACENAYPVNPVAMHDCCLECYNHAALEKIATECGLI